MRFFALLAFGIMVHVNAFMRLPPMQKSTNKLVLRQKSMRLNMIVVDQPDESERPVISVGEYFTPPQIDRTNLIVTLIGQGILTAFAFGSGILSKTNVLNNINFDLDSMQFAFTFGTLMLGKFTIFVSCRINVCVFNRSACFPPLLNFS